MREQIKIIRSNRKTLALEINSMGELVARAPYRLSEREISNFVETKSDWIEKQLKQIGNAVPVLLAKAIATPIASWASNFIKYR